MKNITFGKNKEFLKMLSVSVLFLFSVGCSKPKQSIINIGYDAKQIQCGNLERMYVICKRCIEYTKINELKNNDWRGKNVTQKTKEAEPLLQCCSKE